MAADDPGPVRGERDPARRELRRLATARDRQDPVPVRMFHHERFLVQFSVGTLPHDKLMHAIELLGKEVVPVVKQELARRGAE